MSISQYALAQALGVPEMRISAIVNAKRGISPDTARRLRRSSGTTHAFWFGMHTTYDLELKRDRTGAAIDAAVKPRAA